MTGKVITRTRFPACKGGYNKGQVNFFLARIADLTDKGFAPDRHPPLQGFNRPSVGAATIQRPSTAI